MATKKSNTISFEQATKDFESWLDSKRVTSKKREKNEEAQDVIVSAIQEGILIVNPDMTITQKLLWPTGEEDKGVKELIYKNRMTVLDRNRAVKGIKANDGEGRLQAYIAELTAQPRGVISKLDSGDDFEISQSIAVYFL